MYQILRKKYSALEVIPYTIQTATPSAFPLSVASNITLEYANSTLLMYCPELPAGQTANPRVVLKLDKPRVVQQISFGKIHDCLRFSSSLRSFRVWGRLDDQKDRYLEFEGTSQDALGDFMMLEGTLGVHSRPEFFTLRFLSDFGDEIPVASICIEFVSGASDNRAVGGGGGDNLTRRPHIAVAGITLLGDPSLEADIPTFLKKLDKAQLEICHAHIKKLEQQSSSSSSYDGLLDDESKLIEMIDLGLADDALHELPIEIEWEEIIIGNNNNNNSNNKPKQRGGHQAVYHEKKNEMVIFGGWDGNSELDDVWTFDCSELEWTERTPILKNDSIDGPTGRSCHRMVIDNDNSVVYLLGRFFEDEEADGSADFYSLHLNDYSWECLSSDTRMDGGPMEHVFDHSVSIEVDTEKHPYLYCVGGCTSSASSINGEKGIVIGGCYRYNIRNGSWETMLIDVSEVPPHVAPPVLAARNLAYGASTIVIPTPNRYMLMLCGSRGISGYQFTDSFRALDLDSKDFWDLCGNSNRGDGRPPRGFMQRIVYLKEHDLIVVVCGLVADRITGGEVVSNQVYMFDLKSLQWRRVLCRSTNASNMLPRFAFSLIATKEGNCILFGGNLSRSSHSRLDDMWRMKIVHKGREYLKYLVRHHLGVLKVSEMLLHGEKVEALERLPVLMSDAEKFGYQNHREEIRGIVLHAFGSKQPHDDGTARKLRYECYEKISSMFCGSNRHTISTSNFLWPNSRDAYGKGRSSLFE